MHNKLSILTFFFGFLVNKAFGFANILSGAFLATYSIIHTIQGMYVNIHHLSNSFDLSLQAYQSTHLYNPELGTEHLIPNLPESTYHGLMHPSVMYLHPTLPHQHHIDSFMHHMHGSSDHFNYNMDLKSHHHQNLEINGNNHYQHDGHLGIYHGMSSSINNGPLSSSEFHRNIFHNVHSDTGTNVDSVSISDTPNMANPISHNSIINNYVASILSKNDLHNIISSDYTHSLIVHNGQSLLDNGANSGMEAATATATANSNPGNQPNQSMEFIGVFNYVTPFIFLTSGITSLSIGLLTLHTKKSRKRKLYLVR
ncbi:hypothetical protein cand_020140 [Cryptosporidium andersoni]|uniref:Transmembrane protein n=1 Tax=Cryptosporidium andersoni TaxID=117008 RepID=A0A1J4MSZ5_9CRYT|nr:hypothetical protein cand_020140 [Cryptosporidium andersoni]